VAFVSDRHFPRHSHDQFGVGVICRGGQRSWSALGTVRAGAGDVIMVNPGEMHDGAPWGESLREWRMLYLDPALVATELTEEFVGSTAIVRPVAEDAVLARRVTALFDSLIGGHADALASEEEMLRAIVCLFQRHGVARRTPVRPAPPVARAVEALDAEPARSTTLAELAALSGVSRYQLLRGFARAMGTTPHAYLVQKRVLLAQRYLAAGQALAQAAALAGFADQSHMTRAFVRQTGVTPGAYRAAVVL